MRTWTGSACFILMKQGQNGGEPVAAAKNREALQDHAEESFNIYKQPLKWVFHDQSATGSYWVSEDRDGKHDYFIVHSTYIQPAVQTAPVKGDG